MFLIAASITFAVIWLLLTNLGAHWVRRVVGYQIATDLVVHGSILWMFLGTSTLGLLQAEAAGIMFSVWMCYYRWAWGYERLSLTAGWLRYRGRFT
jgi:hypothetical protein